MPEPSAAMVVRAWKIVPCGIGRCSQWDAPGRILCRDHTSIALALDALTAERDAVMTRELIAAETDRDALRASLSRTFARLTCTVGALSDLTNVAEGIAECHDAIDDEERAELLHVVRSARDELALTSDSLRTRGEARERVIAAARTLGRRYRISTINHPPDDVRVPDVLETSDDLTRDDDVLALLDALVALEGRA